MLACERFGTLAIHPSGKMLYVVCAPFALVSRSAAGLILDGVEHGGHLIGAVAELHCPFEVGQDELRDAPVHVVLPAETRDVLDGAAIGRHPPLGWEAKPKIADEIAAGQHDLSRIAERAPDLEVEGEMHADAALSRPILNRIFPDSRLTAEANLLIMPNLDAANIAFNALKVVAGQGISVGPILLGGGQTGSHSDADRDRARHREHDRAHGG